MTYFDRSSRDGDANRDEEPTWPQLIMVLHVMIPSQKLTGHAAIIQGYSRTITVFLGQYRKSSESTFAPTRPPNGNIRRQTDRISGHSTVYPDGIDSGDVAAHIGNHWLVWSLFEKGGMTLIAAASYRTGESLARTLNRFKSLYLFNDAHASCLYTFNLADIPRTRSGKTSGKTGENRVEMRAALDAVWTTARGPVAKSQFAVQFVEFYCRFFLQNKG